MQRDTLDLQLLRQQAERRRCYNKLYKYLERGCSISFILILFYDLTLLPGRINDSITLPLVGGILTFWSVGIMVIVFLQNSQALKGFYRVFPEITDGFPKTIFFLFILPLRLVVRRVLPLYIIIFVSLKYGIIFGLSVYLYGVAMHYGLQWGYSNPYMKGRYITAQNRLRWIRRLLPQNLWFKTFNAAAHLASSNLEYAEQLYNEMLQTSKRMIQPLYATFAMNGLGYIAILKGHYEEGKEYLEKAVQIYPDLGFIYSNLAFYYLRQNFAPERAFDLCKQAIEYASSIPDRNLQMAIVARALAQQGQHSAALAQSYEAIQTAPRNNVPYLAATYRQVGHVQLELGDPKAAYNDFKHAANIDPDGIHGKLAQQELDKLNT